MSQSEIEFYDSGLAEFEKMMQEYAKISEEKALDAVEKGARELISENCRNQEVKSVRQGIHIL